MTDSPLASIQYKDVMRASGHFVSKSIVRYHKVDRYPFVGTSSEGEPDIALLPAPDGWQLDMVAGTNPSRPMLTPPTMLQDLIDLPGMIREAGKIILDPRRIASAKGMANAHLAVRFGWLPLFDDLHKLLNFQSHVLKRTKELHQLYSGKGLHRRLQFGSDTKTYAGYYVLPGVYGSGVRIPVSINVAKKSWGTIRWKPTTPPPYHPNDEKWNQHATRLLLGFTPEGMMKGLWDVLPWSWLLGWFTNVGKYTLYHSNTVPASFSHINYMCKVEIEHRAGPPTYSSCDGNISTSGQYAYTIRSRSPGNGVVTPGLNMPFLDMSRLSVLASLAVQRLRR